MTIDTNTPCRGEPEKLDSLRAFSAVLKSFRRRARLTQEELASQIGYSVQTLASIEQGRRFPSADFVDQVEDALDAFDTLRDAAAKLSRRPGLADWFHQWAQLEPEAISLYTYECRLIPGLLQTEAYARTLFTNQLPPLDDDQIEAQWAARANRQRILDEHPNAAYSFILEEGAFHRRTGGRQVTKGAIERVLQVARRRNVKVQMMPQVAEAHAGLDGPMQLLETPDTKWFAYMEGQRGGQFLSDPKELSVLHQRYAIMRSQALSPDESVSLLEQMRGAL